MVGRICCDGNGKFNDKSVLLEGSREQSQGERVVLDLSELDLFSLFPGQVGREAVMNQSVASALRMCLSPARDCGVCSVRELVINWLQFHTQNDRFSNSAPSPDRRRRGRESGREQDNRQEDSPGILYA